MFQPFRFLHASDLNLHQPCLVRESSSAVPTDLLLAHIAAAESVFETARSEKVDFVVLSGDIIQPSLAGARELSFLTRQFEQLAELDIAVYWAGGIKDGFNQWPEHWNWPDNVHYFAHRRVEEVSHFRDDEPICTILGKSCNGEPQLRPADFRHSGTDPAIAVAYGEAEQESFAQPGITYWALGGRMERHTLMKSEHYAHYAGTHQARSSCDVGPRGCTLVEVASRQQVRTQFIATDRIRWVEESVSLGQATSQDDVSLLLMDRLQRFQAESSNHTLYITWTLKSNQISTPEKQQDLAIGCEQTLRDAYPRYHFTIQSDTEEPIPEEWYEEESILGDFLRSIQEHEGSQKPLQIEAALSEPQRMGGLRDALAIRSEAEKRELLRECAKLGSYLLRRETPRMT